MGFNKDIACMHDTGSVENCNLLVGSHNHMHSIRVRSSDINKPNTNEQGLLWFMCDIEYYSEDPNAEGISANRGCQYFLGLNTGKIFQRRITNISIGPPPSMPVLPATQFGQWKEISGGGTMTDFIKRPEIENKINDANLLRYSGIFRTHENEGSGETKNLPEGASRWGVLQNFYENDGSGQVQDIEKEKSQTGFQLYAPIDKEKAGSLFIRVKKPQVTWANTPWHELKIHNILQMQDKVYTHPSRTATDIDDEIQNDYVATTEEVTLAGNFPSGVSKHGLLKTFRTPLGFTKQTYTPLEGVFAGYEYSRIGNPITTFIEGQPRIETTSWSEWNTSAENSLKISMVGNLDVKDPMELIMTLKSKVGDKVFYNYFNNQSLNLPDYQHLGVASIVRTAVLTGPDSHDKDQFVYQTAYTEKGNKVFVRSSELSQEGQIFHWGQWKELTATGGGTGQQIDLEAMFNSWRSSIT